MARVARAVEKLQAHNEHLQRMLNLPSARKDIAEAEARIWEECAKIAIEARYPLGTTGTYQDIVKGWDLACQFINKALRSRASERKPHASEAPKK